MTGIANPMKKLQTISRDAADAIIKEEYRVMAEHKAEKLKADKLVIEQELVHARERFADAFEKKKAAFLTGENTYPWLNFSVTCPENLQWESRKELHKMLKEEIKESVGHVTEYSTASLSGFSVSVVSPTKEEVETHQRSMMRD